MIEQAIAHVVAELNDYFNLRLGVADRVVAESLFELDGQANKDANDKVVLSLVNVEEDRVYRSVETFDRIPGSDAERIRPPVRINLYALLVANLSTYSEAMKSIAHVISFFQHRSAFPYSSIPALSDREGRMVVELFTLSFEQINHLWGAIGAKYMPSVMYKFGIVELEDRKVEARVRPVEEIRVNEGPDE